MRGYLSDILSRSGFSQVCIEVLVSAALVAAAFFVSFCVVRLSKMGLVVLLKRANLRRYDAQAQILRRHGVLKKMSALLAPAALLCMLPHVLPREYVGDEVFGILTKCIMLYFYCALWVFLMGAMSAFYDVISMRSRKSIRGFEQITQLAATLVILLLAAAMLFGESPVKVLAGLGASAAVLMLVFKDALLGFVASVQLTLNNMLQTGDWITMEKYGADGVVIEIGLTVVKVRNWDNTITNIPTYALVSDSYRNWRGMTDSGGRRVMRHILIDLSCVKFCDAPMLLRFSKIALLRDFLRGRLRAGAAFDASRGIAPNDFYNATKLTNIGVFRAYLERYLASRPEVNLQMTHFVRQLQPTEKGLPLELYFFTTTDWLAYENVQADIFDHVIASAALFDLRMFQDESDARA